MVDGLSRLKGAARALFPGVFVAVITGGAVAICGASAAMAISAALPAHERKERDTLKPITLMALETAFIAGLILAAIFWF